MGLNGPPCMRGLRKERVLLWGVWREKKAWNKKAKWGVDL